MLSLYAYTMNNNSVKSGLNNTQTFVSLWLLVVTASSEVLGVSPAPLQFLMTVYVPVAPQDLPRNSPSYHEGHTGLALTDTFSKCIYGTTCL